MPREFVCLRPYLIHILISYHSAASRKKSSHSISANAILHILAIFKKSDKVEIEIGKGAALKKALYVRSLDKIYAFCPMAKKYLTNDPASTFDSVRQWGMHALGVSRLSVKGEARVDNRTIKWHETRGEDPIAII